MPHPFPDLTDQFLELIRRASTVLPADVAASIRAAAAREDDGSVARRVLLSLLDNAAAAQKESGPICQDTGTLILHAGYGPGLSQRVLEGQFKTAVAEATKKSYLRPNAVDSVTGRNSGTNLGEGSPLMIFHEQEAVGVTATLMLKGGGCENVGIQYTVPDERIGAGRDLAGVRKCILDAAHRAQGFGCAPGVLGVCIGGDRMSGYQTAKEQLLRRVDDQNPVPALAALEARCLGEINTLGIGPMGFGGRTTALGVKIGARHRVPASFYVSVAYMCWAFRRCTMRWADGKAAFVS